MARKLRSENRLGAEGSGSGAEKVETISDARSVRRAPAVGRQRLRRRKALLSEGENLVTPDTGLRPVASGRARYTAGPWPESSSSACREARARNSPGGS